MTVLAGERPIVIGPPWVGAIRCSRWAAVPFRISRTITEFGQLRALYYLLHPLTHDRTLESHRARSGRAVGPAAATRLRARGPPHGRDGSEQAGDHRCARPRDRRRRRRPGHRAGPQG